MGSVAITTPHDSTTSINWSATVLLAALTGANLAPAADDYVRAAAGELLRGYLLGGHAPTLQTAYVPQAITSATTYVKEPDSWQELESLEDDWDAAGAKKVSPQAIAHARRFLTSLPSIGQTFVPFPDMDGGVGLQARAADKAAYLIVSPDNLFTYVIKVAGKVHRGINTEPDEMKDLLALLY